MNTLINRFKLVLLLHFFKSTKKAWVLFFFVLNLFRSLYNKKPSKVNYYCCLTFNKSIGCFHFKPKYNMLTLMKGLEKQTGGFKLFASIKSLLLGRKQLIFCTQQQSIHSQKSFSIYGFKRHAHWFSKSNFKKH